MSYDLGDILRDAIVQGNDARKRRHQNLGEFVEKVLNNPSISSLTIDNGAVDVFGRVKHVRMVREGDKITIELTEV
jgi:hypothetical protein